MGTRFVEGVLDTNHALPQKLALNSSGQIIIATLSGEDQTADLIVVENRYTPQHCTADVQVKAGAGFLHTLTFACLDAAPTAGSIIIYDSLTETGTIIYSETFDTTAFRGYTVTINGTFSTGLYVGFTTTADIGCTVSYR